MNNCKNMDKKCEYADRLGMCENITATCARKRTMRLIDADALKANVPNTNVDIFENCRNCNTLMDWQVKELIDKMPTIDMTLVMKKPIETSTIELLKEGGLKLEVRSEVVRCKDCKWHEKNGCELLNLWMMHMDDFFCAFGEVKNNEID